MAKKEEDDPTFLDTALLEASHCMQATLKLERHLQESFDKVK